MSDKEKKYNKLKGTTFLSINSLYTGPDHLLSVKNNLFSEEYSRFYYKDIQAIITRKTSRDRVINILFSIIIILVLIPAVMVTGGWSVFFYVLAGILIIPLVINILKGPTSVSHIQTPIQTAKLSAISRIRGNNKALAQLKPLIEKTQGVLTEEQIKGIRPHKKSETPDNTLYKILKHEDGIFHLAVFSLLSLTALFTAVDIFYQNLILSLLSSAVVISMVILLIIALIKQKSSDLFKSIKVMAWSTIGYLCVITIFSNVLSFIVTIQNPEGVNTQWELMKKISALSPLENPWILGVSLFSLVFSLTIGISGIVKTFKFRREYRAVQEKQRPVKENSGLDYE